MKIINENEKIIIWQAYAKLSYRIETIKDFYLNAVNTIRFNSSKLFLLQIWPHGNTVLYFAATGYVVAGKIPSIKLYGSYVSNLIFLCLKMKYKPAVFG